MLFDRNYLSISEKPSEINLDWILSPVPPYDKLTYFERYVIYCLHTGTKKVDLAEEIGISVRSLFRLIKDISDRIAID